LIGGEQGKCHCRLLEEEGAPDMWARDVSETQREASGARSRELGQAACWARRSAQAERGETGKRRRAARAGGRWAAGDRWLLG
jgi:hypothetical protein